MAARWVSRDHFIFYITRTGHGKYTMFFKLFALLWFLEPWSIDVMLEVQVSAVTRRPQA